MARYEFILPDIGEGMTEAEVLRWLVPVGGSVAKDQPVVELQTDKATIEIPSPKAGVMLEHHGREGQVLLVGNVLFALEVEGARAAPVPAPAPVATPVAAAAVARSGGTAIPQAAPAVRRAAREAGIDLGLVAGTGPGGRIQMSDVQVAIAAASTPLAQAATAVMAPPAPVAVPVPAAPVADSAAAEERIPLRGVRRVIAQRMERTLTVPTFTALDEADVTDLVAWRQQLQARLGTKLTYLPFVIKAVVLALQANPQLNGHFDEEAREFILKRYYHIGVGTAAEQGLVVPVLRDAGQRSVLELAQELSEKISRARNNQLGREELTGSTFTISNFGALGGMSGTPILNTPEVGILGVGRIDELPRIRAGQFVARQIMHLSLTVDHRIVDGDHAAGFLRSLKSYLEEPALLAVTLR